MLHALDTIVNAISSVIDIVVQFIQVTIRFFLQVGLAIAAVTKIISFLPVQFTVMAFSIVGLLLVINILNKGG